MKNNRYESSMKISSYGYCGIIFIVLLLLLTSCGSYRMTEKERQINYEIDKAYLEYIYKRDSLIIEYNKQ